MFYLPCYKLFISDWGQKKVSGFWSSVGFKIGAVTCFLGGNVGVVFFVCFCFASRDTWYTVHAEVIFPIIQSMVAKRGLTNRTNVHTQHGKNLIDPAILAAIGHRFIDEQKRKLKLLRPETGLFVWPRVEINHYFELQWILYLIDAAYATSIKMTKIYIIM